jgi:hypothetical protein
MRAMTDGLGGHDCGQLGIHLEGFVEGISISHHHHHSVRQNDAGRGRMKTQV